MRSHLRLRRLFSTTNAARKQQSSPLADTHAPFLALLKDYCMNVSSNGAIQVHKHCDGKVIELVISNESKRNCLTAKMMLDLARVVDEEVEQQQQQQQQNETTTTVGLILRGVGRQSFCSGLDLSLAKNLINDAQKAGLMQSFMSDALMRIRKSSLVSVSIINAAAIGGGSELITSTDYRLMESSSYIQYVHAKIGAAPGFGGVDRLLDCVGRKHALTLLGTSARVDASSALAMGLVDGTFTWLDLGEATTHKKNEDEGEYEMRLTLQGLKFLEPFLAQPYASAVKEIKTLVASHSKEAERDVFMRRWFSKENKHAIGIGREQKK